MHMRYRARRPTTCGSTRTAPATPCAFRCRAPAPRCSRTWRRRSTSTGCSTWRAKPRRSPAPRRVAAALLAGLDDRVLGGRAGRGHLPSLHLRGGRARSLPRSRCAGAVQRPVDPDAASPASMRAVYEGLAFAARDCYLATGSIPREVRLGGGAARSQAMRVILASALDARCGPSAARRPGAAGAVMMAAVNHRRSIPTWRPAPRHGSTPSLGEATVPDPSSYRLYAQALRRSIAPSREAMPAGPGPRSDAVCGRSRTS